jgi:XTP/dITP diphosphohydrolase
MLLLASTNAGKVKEFKYLLGHGVKAVAPWDPQFNGKQAPTVIEDGNSYFEHALKKAWAFYEVFKIPVLADDSGLEVDLLQGRPGVHSATYWGEKLSWLERWKKLYSELGSEPKEKWTARFRCVLCYYDGKNVPQFFEGTVEGMILPEPSGENGFGYDPIFYCNLLKKSFGQAELAEKALVSHRAKAISEFLRTVKP